MRIRSTLPNRRAGFTLIEMLVVLTVILVLASLAVLFVPKINERRKPAIGAERLQAALFNAKARTVRDQSPRGVRIQPVPIITQSRNAIAAGSVTVTPAAMGGVTPSLPVAAPPQLINLSPVGLPWSIHVGSVLVVYDPDPINSGDFELFSNLEVVTVQGVSPAVGPTSFTATFGRPHAAGCYIKVLAYAQELQYIEQPDDFVVVPAFFTGDTARPVTVPEVAFPGVEAVYGPRYRNSIVVLEPVPTMPTPSPYPGDFTGGLHFIGPMASPQPRNQTLWPVQPGDYVEIKGGGPMRLIAGVWRSTTTPVPGTNPPEWEGDILVLDHPPIMGAPPPPPMRPSVLPHSFSATREYRVVRTPRLLAGEPSVKLPQDVAIDLDKNFTYAVSFNGVTFPSITSPLPIDPNTGAIDILFSPTGGVIGRGTANDRIQLWVRDVTQDTATSTGAPTQFEQGLITTYIRTGFIAAFPVDTGNVNGAFQPNPGAAGYDPRPYITPYRFSLAGAHATGL